MTINDLEQIKARDVVDTNGVPYLEFRKGLKPRFFRVWIDIVSGYLGLVITAAAVLWTSKHYPSLFWVSIPLGAILFGYIIAYIQLFIHEAAHFNIHPDRKTNDLLANAIIGILSGLNIKSYRDIHWLHHVHLGTTKDTEFSYFEPLSWRFILESITLIKPMKVLIARKKNLNQDGATNKHEAGDRKMFYLMALFNISLVLLTFWMGCWQLGLAWCGGVIVFFPFFGALRQLLEHRDLKAEDTTDYKQVNHGRVSRMFVVNWLSNTFGGAGFVRHMLHHWDPQASYTRLREIEEFLLNTDSCGDIICKSRTTYSRTFLNLFH